MSEEKKSGSYKLSRRDFLIMMGAGAASAVGSELLNALTPIKAQGGTTTETPTPSPIPPSETPAPTMVTPRDPAEMAKLPGKNLAEKMRRIHSDMLLTEALPKEVLLADDQRTYCLNCSAYSANEVQQIIHSANQKWNAAPAPAWNKYLLVSDGEIERMSLRFVQDMTYEQDSADEYRAGFISSLERAKGKELLVLRFINQSAKSHYLVVYDMTQSQYLQTMSAFTEASSAEAYLSRGQTGYAQNLLLSNSLKFAKNALRQRVGYQALIRVHLRFPNTGWWAKENRRQDYAAHFAGIIQAIDRGWAPPAVDPQMAPYYDIQMELTGATIVFNKKVAT